MNDNSKENMAKKPIKENAFVRGQTVFSYEEIAKVKKDKKNEFAREMEIYNLRALRGDFDTY